MRLCSLARLGAGLDVRQHAQVEVQVGAHGVEVALRQGVVVRLPLVLPPSGVRIRFRGTVLGIGSAVG